MMKKITFITDTLSSGGSERVMSVLANELSKSNMVEIICLSGKESFYPINNNVRLTFLEEKYGKNLLKKFLWLSKYIHSDSLVIPFMVNVYIFTLTALMFKKVKIIVSERNDPKTHPIFIRILRKILIWRAQRVVVQTLDIANYFPRLIREKIDIIYNPISDKYIWKSGLKAEKKKIIITVGRLSPQKNHIMLINAFAKVIEKYPEYQLHIYGDGEIREKTESYIKAKGLEENVILKGRCNSLGDVLPQAEIFAMSSNYEGMSNALIEAMYVGVPVVTTAVSGTKELIEDGTNGFVVPIGDEKSLAEALMKLVENKALREQFAEKGVDIIKKVHPSMIFKQWKTIIKNI